MNTKPIADMFQVSPAWARRLNQRRCESGQLTAKPIGGAHVVKIDLAKLRELVNQQPDATLHELHQ